MESQENNFNDRFQQIIEDIDLLSSKPKIPIDEIDKVIQQLKSKEAKQYIQNLIEGSKPETALREAFFAGDSILSKYLSSDMKPEINLGVAGFVDYKLGVGRKAVLLELKSLFELDMINTKSGREVKGLKQSTLSWTSHEEQILKYIQKEGAFIVITNLKDWHFFDQTITAGDCSPFYSADLKKFNADFSMVNDLFKYLERQNFQSVRGELDTEFFKSLTSWTKTLSEIEFEENEKHSKTDLVISILNKFIGFMNIMIQNYLHYIF